MGTNRRRRSEEEESASSDGEDGGAITKTKTAKTESDDGVVVSASSSHYEQIREQRMKENAERMHKLGLFKLSGNLKKTPTQRPCVKKNSLPSNQSERRSSRLSTLPPVNYCFKRPKAERQESSSSKKRKEVEIHIPEGTNPEVYTEEHEKLLGDCETDWELYVDGYDEDGDHIYDPTKGEKCHQCGGMTKWLGGFFDNRHSQFLNGGPPPWRHRHWRLTVAQLTDCNKCELPQGWLCGDCLYTRYGENVTEANINPKWTCPSCREICNCNSCRRKNGWMPTGNIYNKVTKLGFKSVAHYLIKTRRSEESMEGLGAENNVAKEIPEISPDSTLTRTLSRPIRTRRALRS